MKNLIIEGYPPIVSPECFLRRPTASDLPSPSPSPSSSPPSSIEIDKCDCCEKQAKILCVDCCLSRCYECDEIIHKMGSMNKHKRIYYYHRFPNDTILKLVTTSLGMEETPILTPENLEVPVSSLLCSKHEHEEEEKMKKKIIFYCPSGCGGLCERCLLDCNHRSDIESIESMKIDMTSYLSHFLSLEHSQGIGMDKMRSWVDELERHTEESFHKIKILIETIHSELTDAFKESRIKLENRITSDKIITRNYKDSYTLIDNYLIQYSQNTFIQKQARDKIKDFGKYIDGMVEKDPAFKKYEEFKENEEERRETVEEIFTVTRKGIKAILDEKVKVFKKVILDMS